jgi:DNA-binding response OmpR family regulator
MRRGPPASRAAPIEEQGYTVEVAHNGDDARDPGATRSYDALVLDMMLPGRDGLSILRRLRDAHNPVPVLIVTARDALDERLEGLNLGADDYLTKPFFVEELIARLWAVTRRTAGEKLTVLSSGELSVDLISRQGAAGEEAVELTAREFALLEYLMRSPGRVYPRTQILEHVWGYDFDPGSNLVDVNIQRLRRKIDPDGEAGYIKTVRGVGYRFRSRAESDS